MANGGLIDEDFVAEVGTPLCGRSGHTCKFISMANGGLIDEAFVAEVGTPPVNSSTWLMVVLMRRTLRQNWTDPCNFSVASESGDNRYLLHP